MPIITLKPYGNNRHREKVMITRIVAFRTHESNGYSGTEIDLDTGDKILVGDYEQVVEGKIKDAIREYKNES